MTAQAVSETLGPIPKKARVENSVSVAEDAVCDVCFDGDSDPNNAILFCDGCNVAVHQDCYGVPSVPSGRWYCDWCSEHPNAAPNRECAVCPNKGGSLKRCCSPQAADTKRHRKSADTAHSWVHTCCVIWTPELYYEDKDSKRGVLGLEKVDKRRWNRRCVVCKKDSGACIQCASTDPYCAKWFHAYCSFKSNLKHGSFNCWSCLCDVVS